MNDYNIDDHDFGRHVREAQQMRSEAIRALLASGAVHLRNFGHRLGTLVRAWRQRRAWNQSVPAAHR
jgi:hypothetical protein